VKIRLYEHADWDSFLALEIETSLSAAQITAPIEIDAFKQRWPTVLRDTYQWGDGGPSAENQKVWVLVADDGFYLGQLWLTKQADFFTLKPKLFVTAIAIVGTARGRGFGTLLLAHAREQAIALGCEELALAVSAENTAAIELYEKFGFETARRSMVLMLADEITTTGDLRV
jgi:ribosomal protein S18 acetylase RimI-like enzyme